MFGLWVHKFSKLMPINVWLHSELQHIDSESIPRTHFSWLRNSGQSRRKGWSRMIIYCPLKPDLRNWMNIIYTQYWMNSDTTDDAAHKLSSCRNTYRYTNNNSSSSFPLPSPHLLQLTSCSAWESWIMSQRTVLSTPHHFQSEAVCTYTVGSAPTISTIWLNSALSSSCN